MIRIIATGRWFSPSTRSGHAGLGVGPIGFCPRSDPVTRSSRHPQYPTTTLDAPRQPQKGMSTPHTGESRPTLAGCTRRPAPQRHTVRGTPAHFLPGGAVPLPGPGDAMVGLSRVHSAPGSRPAASSSYRLLGLPVASLPPPPPPVAWALFPLPLRLGGFAVPCLMSSAPHGQNDLAAAQYGVIGVGLGCRGRSRIIVGSRGFDVRLRGYRGWPGLSRARPGCRGCRPQGDAPPWLWARSRGP
jgi:hypothetical protein